MEQPRGVGLVYAGDAYDTGVRRLMGRQVAGAGILRGLARYGQGGPLYCVTDRAESFEQFRRQVVGWADRPREVGWINASDLAALGRAGCLFRPDPLIAAYARRRAAYGHRCFSLCGITWSLASREVQADLRDLVAAPLQPWDAIVCISHAAREVVEKLLAAERDRVALPTGRAEEHPRLPVIPLGVDTASFPAADGDPLAARARLRQRLGIAEDDVAVLFLGRLSFYTKAHPVPMYLAVERAAIATGRRVHLLQAGWFEDEREERAYADAASAFCPSVPCHTLGRDAGQADAWSAADVFISLSDNVAETFGLTVVEAMASGLPVVVSDWDGYRETVRNGVDGFLVPTTIPDVAAGSEAARAYFADRIAYGAYMAHLSLATAVDVDACARVLAALIEDPRLRARMGASGRERARATFDWRHVIARYEELWSELAELRTRAVLRPVPAPSPAGDSSPPEPFGLFRHYATASLRPRSRLRPGGSEDLSALASSWMVGWGANLRLPPSDQEKLLHRVRTAGEMEVDELLADLDQARRPAAERTLLHLAKFGVLRIDPPTGTA